MRLKPTLLAHYASVALAALLLTACGAFTRPATSQEISGQHPAATAVSAESSPTLPVVTKTIGSDRMSSPAASPSSQQGVLAPLAAGECEQLRTAITQTLGLDATMAQAPFADPFTGERGTGCEATAIGTGRQIQDIMITAHRLTTTLTTQGWAEDPLYVADGPTGTALGLRKEQRLALLTIFWEPADNARCPQNQPIVACKLEPEQKRYTVTLIGVQ